MRGGLEVLGAADTEADAVRLRFDRLWSGVGDLVLIERIELGVGFALASGEGEHEIFFAAGDGEFCVWREGLGNEGEGFANGTDGLGGRCGCRIYSEVEA